MQNALLHLICRMHCDLWLALGGLQVHVEVQEVADLGLVGASHKNMRHLEGIGSGSSTGPRKR